MRAGSTSDRFSGIGPHATALDLVQQVQARYNSVRTLSVDFTESYSLLGHARPSESGTLTLRKVGKMRWEYHRPAGKLFISDGKTVYLYTAADNRVEKVPLKDTEDMRAPLAFLLGRLNMVKEFRAFATYSDSGLTWLSAAAHNDRVPYSSVKMQVDPGGIIRTLLVEGRDGSLITYHFENERLNPPINDAAFRFQVPPGAQIVDALQTQAAGDNR